jgi:hypothetical protein
MAAIPEGVTLGIAITGAILGILNTWRTFDRDRLRVRVVPVWLISERGSEGMGIEIINLSYLPVTISHIGFTVRWSREHLPVLDGILGGGRLPQRLEPRTRFTALVAMRTVEHPTFARVHRAYATTACGCRFTGSSQALRGQIRQMRAARPQPISQ